MVNGVERNALVYIPKKELLINVPLIFVWHGHGGSAEKFIKRFPVHKLWKEAIVVFPQGVNSKSPWDIKAEKTGWQFQIGDYNDRDIKFFDTMYTYFSNTFPIGAVTMSKRFPNILVKFSTVKFSVLKIFFTTS